jgi:hypothetical protein
MNELPKAIKDRIEAIPLPTHDDICKKLERESAIELFIYEHEPFNGNDFRIDLQAALTEARESEALRAQPLLEALEKIRKEVQDGSWFAKTIDKAIKNYNSK